MARYHDVRIDVADPRVSAIEVNGTFRIDDVDGLLNAIETLLPVRFERLPTQGDMRLYRAFYQVKNTASQ
jgi:ferric-dicitrate binding protein FerR (iron transport regulator)